MREKELMEKEEKPLEKGMKERQIEDEMKESYIDYSMSVIVGRALPDARDGLKPVHRRILYAMYKMGLFHDKPYKKCARIVGEVLGKYHPHGDQAVYDSLVRMAQDFSMRYRLVRGQGNFGSVDGDNPAAMRYTESKMEKISEEMLKDIKKETVAFEPNFDGSLKEPVVLPSAFPNLLVNGTSGIAVGMATSVPPHNIGEVVDGTIAAIDNPEITLTELMEHIKGPDFPTGGHILGRPGIIQSYQTGRGSITIRSRAEIEKKDKKERIVVTEIPYRVNKADLIEYTASLVRDKKIEGISNIRDESDKEGLRIIIEVSRGYPAEIVLNNLYKKTRFQDTFGCNLVALTGNVPRTLTLKDMVTEFIKHRKEVVVKRTEFDLRKARERSHILEGLIKALDYIDPVIKTIKSSDTVEDAEKRLVSRFKLTEKQAEAILEMQLQKLASLEQKKLRDEQADLSKLIRELEELLASEEKIYGTIKEELREIKKVYGDERKTEIVDTGECLEDLDDERLIKEEDVVITVSKNDYVKRIPLETYSQQNRGGKGIIGARTKEGDIIKEMFVANTHDYLLCFTNSGKVYWLKAYKIPEAGRYGKGRPIINLLNVEKGESVRDVIYVRDFSKGGYVFFSTKKGTVKKTRLKDFSRPRSCGIRAIKLREKDRLIGVRLTDGEKDIMLATKKGIAIRFCEKDVRVMGRVSSGVRGIRLRKGDDVVDMCIVEPGASLLTVSEKGYGKRTGFEKYRVQGRGGKGIKNMNITGKNGEVVGMTALHESDEVLFMSRKGMIIRTVAGNISEIGRNTQGVRVMRLAEDDSLVSMARIRETE